MKNISFKNLDITINNGELVGVIGPNGSGKTHLLEILCGKKNNDNVYIDDKCMNEYTIDYKKKNIVSVFNDSLYNTKSVIEELKYYLNKVSFNDIDELVKEFSGYFKLDAIINEDIFDLTVENKVYIKILSLLIIKPSIFSIDDMLTYLSIDKKNKILNYIKENNITLINVTSNMEELLLMDKVLVMNKGIKDLFDKTEIVLDKEEVFNELGLSLPFIYDINNLLKSYELISQNHIVYKELVDVLWK